MEGEVILVFFTYESAKGMDQKQLTESVKARAQRRVTDSKFFNHTSWLAIGVLTPDGRVLEISKTMLDESDLLFEEVVGKPFVELPGWSYSVEAKRQIRQAIERAGRGETVQMDIRAYPTKEFYRDLDVTIMPFVSRDSQASYLIYTGVDITECTWLKEERYAFIDSIPDLCWLASPDGPMQYLNRQWHTYTQTSSDLIQEDV